MKCGKMKRLRLNSRARKAFHGRSRGFTLIEVVIAMVLLGIIGVAIFSALSYASTVLIVADRQATAESLAKTQMEYIKNKIYSPAPNGGVGNYTKISEIPTGYTIWSVGRNGTIVNGGTNDPVIGIPWDSAGNTASYNDTGLQKITLIVSYNILRYDITSQKSTSVAQNFTLEDYKRQPVT
jgi:prepilin-type N-terminal cleavage/methylation domain-containing protein